MRIDRLLGITLHLMNRETVSASALAARFEVSKRTIQRDIDALCKAGIPVVAVHGAGGGYAVLDGFRLAKQLAGPEDFGHIVTALRGLASAGGGEGVRATLDKAMLAMRPEAQRVFVDFSAALEGPLIAAYLPVIERAAAEQAALRIEYTNALGDFSVRTVEPLALTYQWHAWYVFAFDLVKEDYRLFKLARMAACAPTGEAFTRVHGDPEPLMRAAAAKRTDEVLAVRLLCTKQARAQVLEYLRGEIIEERENGDFVLLMAVPFERMWFSLLMGFGDQVEVIGPQAVRDRLRLMAEQITRLY